MLLIHFQGVLQLLLLKSIIKLEFLKPSNAKSKSFYIIHHILTSLLQKSTAKKNIQNSTQTKKGQTHKQKSLMPYQQIKLFWSHKLSYNTQNIFKKPTDPTRKASKQKLKLKPRDSITKDQHIKQVFHFKVLQNVL